MSQRKSPRMRRLAEHLSVIRISLNPPSPPPSPPLQPSPSPSSKLPASWLHEYPISSSRLLQVPRVDPTPDEVPRQCSPPPRRCSYASTTSENSSASMNASYQNLLSPFISLHRSTSRSSSAHSYSDDNETPPNEMLYLLHRAYSSQTLEEYEAVSGGKGRETWTKDVSRKMDP
ncbi:hypothetical protein AAVH_28003 [Aphelenchoides avenae]|nr:hypothetical protein AAVH_28003 [Aphelenchus avenae]